MRHFKAWLSPGTVLGAIALIVALGGTGYAASGTGSERASAAAKHHPKHQLSSSDVRRIAADEIKKEAPRLSVGHATTADTAKTANRAAIATNVFSANVAGDGSLLGSIPTGATSSEGLQGLYDVSFGRSIVGCTIAATLSSNSTAPQLGFIGVGVANATTLRVFTEDQTNTPMNRGFYVQAICPG